MRDEERLVGRWSLQDFVLTLEDGSTVEPLGARPFGLLIYTPTWMSAHLVPEDGEQSFFSYCGPWRIVDGLLHHDVRSSDRPGWIGKVLTRGLEWEDALLALTARGVQHGDQKGIGRLRWERQEDLHTFDQTG